jgi:hypothetical protein
MVRRKDHRNHHPNAKAMTPPIKGYNLSTDYALLYNLILSDGYRVPAWLLDDEIWRIVEVKAGFEGEFRIGVIGHGYGFGSGGYDEFLQTCTAFKLHFIPPPTQP